MRNVLSLLCFVVMLGVALPAEAQLRSDVRSYRAPAQLLDAGATGFTLNRLFSPEHFRMGHSLEMSMGSGGGHTSSLGMYTNSLMWQFNEQFAARVDISYAQNLGGNSGFGMGQQHGQVFIRNAEFAYRPTENTMFQFSFRQSPYGGYMNPHMGYSPFGPAPGNTFWRDTAR
jgi:hypothetical protein